MATLAEGSEQPWPRSQRGLIKISTLEVVSDIEVGALHASAGRTRVTHLMRPLWGAVTRLERGRWWWW